MNTQKRPRQKAPLTLNRITLLLLGAIVLLATADAFRPPPRQVTAALYTVALDGYQQYIHPLTHTFIRCRYTPSCSHYSALAVQRYGIAQGLWMTLRRIHSCRRSVPMGTYDPVS